MRKATQDTDMIFREEEDFVGINLGWDFTAEHEWGIKSIKESFGIPQELASSNAGVDFRKISLKPEGLRLVVDDKQEKTYLVFMSSYYSEDRFLPENLERLIVSHRERGIHAAWSGEDFGICVSGDNQNNLKKLFKAFSNNDVIISLAGAVAFGNSGLIIAIASKIPEGVLESMKATDLDCLKLLETAKATGITQRLKDAGIRYMALSPRWADEEKTEVVFWLNPFNQSENNYGNFSVEDLDLWIKGKGPIPKTAWFDNLSSKKKAQLNWAFLL